MDALTGGIAVNVELCDPLTERSLEFTLLDDVSRVDMWLTRAINLGLYPTQNWGDMVIENTIPQNVQIDNNYQYQPNKHNVPYATIKDAQGNSWKLIDYVNGAELGRASTFNGYILEHDYLDEAGNLVKDYKGVMSGTNATVSNTTDGSPTRITQPFAVSNDVVLDGQYAATGIWEDKNFSDNQDFIDKLFVLKDKATTADIKSTVQLLGESQSGFNVEYSNIYAGAQALKTGDVRWANLIDNSFIHNGLSTGPAAQQIIDRLGITADQLTQIEKSQFTNKVVETIVQGDFVGTLSRKAQDAIHGALNTPTLPESILLNKDAYFPTTSPFIQYEYMTPNISQAQFDIKFVQNMLKTDEDTAKRIIESYNLFKNSSTGLSGSADLAGLTKDQLATLTDFLSKDAMYKNFAYHVSEPFNPIARSNKTPDPSNWNIVPHDTTFTTICDPSTEDTPLGRESNKMHDSRDRLHIPGLPINPFNFKPINDHPQNDGGNGYQPEQGSIDYGDETPTQPDLANGQPAIPQAPKPPVKHHHHKKHHWWRFLSVLGPILGIASKADTIVGALRSALAVAEVAVVGPLAIDLNGDGLNTSSWENSKAFFDFTGNGFATSTSWLSKDDGFLAVDWNGDGVINNVNELFGVSEASGFSDLRKYDDNGDNVINSTDSIFSKLRIWQDLNEDGITDPGELKTLQDWNIVSINLNSRSENYSVNGNIISESSTITRANGSTLNIYDVNFQTDTTISKYTGPYNLDPSLTSLPWLRGYGLVKDLLLEASSDSNLAMFLTNLSTQTNSLTVYNSMDELIGRWADIDNSPVGAFPGLTNSQKLDILRQFFALEPDNSDYNSDVQHTLDSYNSLKTKLYVDYIVQTDLGASLGLHYDFYNDQYIIDSNFYQNLVANIANTQDAFATMLICQALDNGGQLDVGQLQTALANAGYNNSLFAFALNQMQLTMQNSDGSVTGDAQNNLIFSTSTTGTLLQGNDGNDILVSASGNDTLQGGNGNDTYILDLQSGNDTISDSSGMDQLILGASINKDNLVFTQVGNDLTLSVFGITFATIQNFYTTGTIETITLTDGTSLSSSQILAMASVISGTSSNDVLTGNNFVNSISGGAGNDTLIGGAGNDTLDGGAGADSMAGGNGNDTYVVDNASDIVSENLLDGNDTILASVSYSLSANVENLTLTGSSNLSATGNALDNVLTSNTGLDTLTGGLGNDTYILNNAADTINENANEGTDTVQIAASYSLGANLENLTLTGGYALYTGTGNALDNVITGNAAPDTLIGGLGNDTYVISNSGTVITENAGEGTDTVVSSVSYTLGANLDNLTLTGTKELSAVGNALDNVITSNNAASNLLGGQGNDTYIVSNPNTLITENAGEGTDTVQSSVSYSLSANVENLTLTGTDNLSGTGNAFNNTITGNSGDNTLDGGTGADTLIGGLGNDTYLVDNTGDTVTENAGEGTDTVLASVSYSLSANVENLTLTGTSALLGTGNTQDNILTDNGAADTLSGGLGNDTYVISNTATQINENNNEGTDTVQSSVSYSLGSNLENLTLTGGLALSGSGNTQDNVLTGNTAADTLTGGLGNDTYIIQNGGTVINENANEGTDTVQSSVSYTLAANLENLILIGTNPISGTGNALANQITGNRGDNTLDGGTGADTLIGGTGNDTYIVDNASDVVVENASEGVDTVQASVSYTLANFVENLTLTGSSAINGTGTSYDNYLTGNSGANILQGLAGNDTLDGGAGADTLMGGIGDDTYIVNNVGDVVVENLGEGTDTVQASINYSLGANVENLTLTGSSALSGTGNTLDNVLTGNSAMDSLIGGTGNDTYVLQNASTVITENANEGTDTVQIAASYTLGANLENLTLTGTTAFSGTGNIQDNILTGNTTADTLTGGLGNDTYVVLNANTVINENAGEGTDTVQASASYSLGANIENLTLTGTDDINGTGNSLNNIITGNSGNNVLDGNLGADTLVGGDGNDTYIVDNAGDVIMEQAGQGIDTVQSSIDYTLSTYLENLTLTGSNNLNGIGNDYDNYLIGNNGASTLTGLGGDDTLDGSIGSDTLIGGSGDDFYIVDNPGDVIIESANEGTDSVQASTDFTLSANVENLTLVDGYATVAVGNSSDNWLVGNSNNNTLTGNAGNDTLDGGTGADTLIGGTGNDFYIVDNIGDMVIENANEGIDTVQSSVSYTLGNNIENLTLTGTINTTGTGNSLDNYLIGNTGNNMLTGNAGKDTLDGGAGVDTLIGGIGDDTYIVDNVGDVVTENSGEGTDTIFASVSYSLSANVENLTLTGTQDLNATGNSGNNILIGNSGNNILNGSSGQDTMIGGLGDDTYFVDQTGDLVIENANEGTDTVQSYMSYTLGNNVDNLTLVSWSGALNASGNELNNYLIGDTANNVLMGFAGDDTLDGSYGADTLIGGLGNDTYIVDNSGDVVTENAGEGTDTVQASISYSLSANVENLTLTGSSNLVGTGNTLDNVLTGNLGNSTLDWRARE